MITALLVILYVFLLDTAPKCFIRDNGKDGLDEDVTSGDCMYVSAKVWGAAGGDKYFLFR